MNKTDYNKEFKCIINRLDAYYRASDIKDAQKKKLLLHACCAPCSSICIERVRDHFDTTVYFFNPNITIEDDQIIIENPNKQNNYGQYRIYQSRKPDCPALQ